jgi:hypothetical protein
MYLHLLLQLWHYLPIYHPLFWEVFYGNRLLIQPLIAPFTPKSIVVIANAHQLLLHHVKFMLKELGSLFRLLLHQSGYNIYCLMMY